MKTCWEILGIEKTTQQETIRQAYRALLPSFHPETDPQGFKQLRQAYEEALRLAQLPDEGAEAVTSGSENDEHEFLRAFRALLASETERFQPSAWQKYIQQLNTLTIDEVDKLRWPLCAIAIEERYMSLNCAALLAERLNWQALSECHGIDEEQLESFIEAIGHGDCFDFLTLAALPVAVQNQTIGYYFGLERCWRYHPEYVIPLYVSQHGAWVIPEDKILHHKLLRWYSALQQGSVELVPLARQWLSEEPESEDAHYSLCAQRLYAGEGETLLPNLCAYWQKFPSTQADSLLLQWCQQYRPDHAALLVMAIEARSMVNDAGTPLKYEPGESARTRLLWAEILHQGKLSPIGRSFVEALLYKRKKWGSRASRLEEPEYKKTSLSEIYQVAEQLIAATTPKPEALAVLKAQLEGADCCPLEAIIIRMILAKADPERVEVARHDSVNASTVNEPHNVKAMIKTALSILITGYVLGKIIMLFS